MLNLQLVLRDQEQIDELERRNLNTALITLCIGGGMGIATIIERYLTKHSLLHQVDDLVQ